MNKTLKIILLAAVLIAVIAAAAIGYNVLKGQMGTPGGLGGAPQQSSGPAETQSPRQKAPDFTVYDKNGEAASLSSLAGKPVVVNFWATWCGYCKKEMGDFQAVYEKYQDQVHFMMVNQTDGQRETVEIAQAYVDENGFTFPVYFDKDLDAAITYGIRSLPTTMLVDKDGNILAFKPGQVSAASLEGAIQKALK